MIKHFCIVCVGLSMMCFFAVTHLKAMESINIEGKPKSYLSLPPIYRNLLSNTGEPWQIVDYNLSLYSQYQFEKQNNRKPTDKEENMRLLYASYAAMRGLYFPFISQVRKEHGREPTPAEIEIKLKQIDEQLRERIYRGDFELKLLEFEE